MKTEENIVYQILDTVRGGRLNDDELLDERDIRSYLRVARANIIRRNYKDAYRITEDEFQALGIVDLVLVGENLTYTLPTLIRLPKNQGIKVTTASGYNVPILSKEEFYLSKANVFNGRLPKGMINNSILTIYPGDVTLTESNMMNNGVGFEAVKVELSTDLKVDIDAVLYDPDDGLNYDWTTSDYPLSGELLAFLKEQVIKSEFSLLLNAKVDEVTNTKSDSIRYHDQGKID